MCTKKFGKNKFFVWLAFLIVLQYFQEVVRACDNCFYFQIVFPGFMMKCTKDASFLYCCDTGSREIWWVTSYTFHVENLVLLRSHVLIDKNINKMVSERNCSATQHFTDKYSNDYFLICDGLLIGYCRRRLAIGEFGRVPEGPRSFYLDIEVYDR